jgi:DNA-binding NarL/FixJ family response regulator
MIRVLVVDDHPAVRAGLVGLLRSEPGLVVAGAAANAEDALEAAKRAGPDVVLLDYDLGNQDGLLLCCDLKALDGSPRVMIYSAFARPRLAPAAALAGADAMLDKGSPPDVLFDAVRRVARATAEPLTAPREAVARCIAELPADDIPLFGMAVNGTPVAEIAQVVGDDVAAIRARLRALVVRLQGERRAPPAPENPLSS